MRPKTLTTPEIVQSVIDSVLAGSSMRKALALHGITPRQFQNVLVSDADLSRHYAQAIEIRADLLADEIIEIADCEQTDPARARNQIQARQWLAGKLHARRYGDRLDLNVTQTIDVAATLAEARQRLLPIRDQQDTIAARYVEIEPPKAPEPSD